MPYTVRRLKNAVGGMDVGTIVMIDVPAVPSNVPAGQSAALLGGLPAGASLFNPATNVFKIRTDTYAGALHPENTAIINEFTRQLGKANAGAAYLNTYQYNANFFLVGPNTPTIEVLFNPWRPGLPKQRLWDTFNQVPWPWNAVPSRGNDRAIILYKPDTDELWEFWKVRPKPGRPSTDNYFNAPYDATIGGEMQSSFGGYFPKASLSRGVYDDDQYGYHYGVAATSISYAGSAISVADVLSGSIEHAIAVQTIFAAPYNQFYWPAMRSDGGSTGNPIREGQRFRFPPDLDVSTLTGLSPLARMIVTAIQKYGMIATDKAGTVSLVAESGGVTINPDGTSTSPWAAGKFFPTGSASYKVLKNIPWQLLQAMPADYGKP